MSHFATRGPDSQKPEVFANEIYEYAVRTSKIPDTRHTTSWRDNFGMGTRNGHIVQNDTVGDVASHPNRLILLEWKLMAGSINEPSAHYVSFGSASSARAMDANRAVKFLPLRENSAPDHLS